MNGGHWRGKARVLLSLSSFFFFCSTLDTMFSSGCAPSVFPHSPCLHDFSSYQAVPTMVLVPTGMLQILTCDNTNYTCCSLILGGQVVANLWVTLWFLFGFPAICSSIQPVLSFKISTFEISGVVSLSWLEFSLIQVVNWQVWVIDYMKDWVDSEGSQMA